MRQECATLRQGILLADCESYTIELSSGNISLPHIFVFWGLVFYSPKVLQSLGGLNFSEETDKWWGSWNILILVPLLYMGGELCEQAGTIVVEDDYHPTPKISQASFLSKEQPMDS